MAGVVFYNELNLILYMNNNELSAYADYVCTDRRTFEDLFAF